jgi:leucyl aminopeptidase
MYRNIRVVPIPARAQPEALAVAVFAKTGKLPAAYATLDRPLGGILAAALARPEFGGGKGEVVTLYPPAGGAGPKRVFLVGLGERAKLNGEVLRLAAAKVERAALAARVATLQLRFLPGLAGALAPETAGAAVGDGLAIARLEFDTRKSGVAGNGKNGGNGKAKDLDLTVQVEPELRAALEHALQIGESMNLARELAVRPPNQINPASLAEYCRKLARRVGLKCRVIEHQEAKRLGMGGLLAVGGAGSAPPAMICLEWEGRGGGARQKQEQKKVGGAHPTGPILLVGKAITFDTGGYSLKSPESMARMKFDKSGGAAVIGVLHAAARLKLPQHVVGVIPAAENMISEKAYRVDDILTFCNGVTAEVTNTDAEGRLILADALAYGCKTYRPRAVIDLATLTGGVVVALGSFCAGLFCNDDALRQRLLAAADATGEKLWHLPLWDEHKQLIKGTYADIVNAGIREASPIQGAVFLSYFVGPEGRPPKGAERGPAWAHLDIAGMSDFKGDTPLYPKGATGFGVRLVVNLLENWG